MSDDLKEKIAKGTAVNFLGVIAKSLHPVFLIIITHLYGPQVVGVYIIANTIIELCISFTFSGLQDGVLLFSSRHFQETGERKIVYNVIANALAIALLLTGIAVVFAHTAAPAFIAWRYKNEELMRAVQIMVFALPFLAIPQIVVSATKSLMIMKYDAILMGALKPGLLTLAAALVYFLGPSVESLASAYLIGNIVVTGIAVYIYRLHFSIGKLMHSLAHFKFQRQLVVFAIPQNLNLTFVYFTSGVSILMLGASDVSKAMIAFYGTGAEIIRHIKQVRLAFSSAFTPVISRLHKLGKLDELGAHYTTLTRWIVTLVFPVIFIVLSVKEPLLLLFHSSYVNDSTFMVVLSVGAFLGCGFGLAANIIAMTGRSMLNFINSIIVASISFFLNWLLIPRLGLMGAALATTLTTFVSVTIKTIQIFIIYRIRLSWKRVRQPFIAGIAATLAFGFFNMLGLEGILEIIVVLVGTLAVYVSALIGLGIDKNDLQVTRSLFSSSQTMSKEMP